MSVLCVVAHAAQSALTGLSVEQVIKQLEARGLAVIYSTDLVTPALRVTTEPHATEPVDITFWHGLTADNDDAIKRLTDAYNASQTKVHVSSENQGRLRLGASEWYVPYSLSIGGMDVALSGTDTLSGPTGEGLTRDALPIHFRIDDVAGRAAGTYSDLISISVTAL